MKQMKQPYCLVAFDFHANGSKTKLTVSVQKCPSRLIQKIKDHVISPFNGTITGFR
jgi:hypothetical protein